jgi:hypothetical protein
MTGFDIAVDEGKIDIIKYLTQNRTDIVNKIVSIVLLIIHSMNKYKFLNSYQFVFI